MGGIGSAFAEAARLIAAADTTLYGIVLLSLEVSLTAVAAATAIGLALGAPLAIHRFPAELQFISAGKLADHAPVERFFAQPSTPGAVALIKGELPWS
jgi:ABC-type tungstate transport system substrate-binding protein